MIKINLILLQLRNYFQEIIWSRANQSEKPRSRKIMKFCPRSMSELSFVGIQQGFPKERIKKKLKCVDSGYRDLKIRIKGIQY